MNEIEKMECEFHEELKLLTDFSEHHAQQREDVINGVLSKARAALASGTLSLNDFAIVAGLARKVPKDAGRTMAKHVGESSPLQSRIPQFMQENGIGHLLNWHQTGDR